MSLKSRWDHMNDLHIVINGDPGTIFCDLSKSPMDLLSLSDMFQRCSLKIFVQITELLSKVQITII